MTTIAGFVEAALAEAIGRPVQIRSRTELGGGDINQVERLDTDSGTFVLKSNARARPGLFSAEARGLAALKASGTSLRIPDVVVCRDQEPAFLVLEDLGDGRRGEGFDDRFGRGLAELHRTRSDRFGFAADGFCGATPQPNPPTSTWIEFYGRARLAPQLERAAARGLLSAPEGRMVERLIGRLDNRLAEPREGPALIHGDLWSGNLHVTSDGAPALIDPAACFAHREAEFGMTTLFGGFSARAYAAYDEAFPLDVGWRERNPLYQLYHLMNHLNLFGSGYHGQVMAIVRRYA